jgi:lysophospholipase L1-like esterase
MRALKAATYSVAVAVMVTATAGAAWAAERPRCAVPDYLLHTDALLKRVPTTISTERRLRIAVVGTGSSALAGPDGPRSAYPARLEAVLNQRLTGEPVTVVTLLRSRQTAEDLAKGMDKVVADEKPNLVIWQTGTIDAIRRIDLDLFKAALDDGVERIHKGRADVILMNMQYSPRTESMISAGPYADVMRLVAQQHDVPLFDRLGIMHHWADVGTFDLYAAGRDNVLAQRVHDCIGRAIAALIIDAGRLQGYAVRAGQ